MKLYFEAEKVLKSKNTNNGSLQSRIFNDKSLKNDPKHIFALVYSTLKYKPYINEIIKKSKIKNDNKKIKISNELLLLLIHDLNFSSKGRIQSGKHPIKDFIMSYKTRLHSELIKLKLRYKVKSIDQLPTHDLDDETPIRWFRINTIKITQEQFYKKHEKFINSFQPVISIEDLTEIGMIYKDDYIPNLFGVSPKDKITTSEPYKLGEIIIQDRASCFPGHILNADPNDQHVKVIDACAAPGNKTTHLGSYISTKEDAVIYAFERDKKRVEILKKMSELATGIKHKHLIQVTNADFTSIDPNDFPDVTGLVVDPSCSGSGIFGRALEEEDKQEVDEQRLKKLASFQVAIMKHALSFPNARKVVYSTCSIHEQENERVVIDLLIDDKVKEQGWKLADKKFVIPEWKRRGIPEEFATISRDEKFCRQLADGCVRSKPKEDGGIGFFAACFVRDDTINREKNETMNSS
ncbi:unnamed protein product [Candida verbasci]|uniref:SAM-dependent MTase RsmB/NOP-type domain-containing protein n=1 Tax=Candida verbasci TaxID=1227364 RepID=A0A9W4TR25_9ASCO|nr:unnamed protein product [Candida verbasci]